MSLSCCLLLFLQLELESPLSKYAAALLIPSLITQSHFHISKKCLQKQKRKRCIDGE